MARGKVVQRDADGAPIRMVGTHMDIMARKAADAALSESNVLTQQIIDNLPHGFAMRDVELRYRRWNPAMERLTGLTAAAAIGKTAAELPLGWSPEQYGDLARTLQRALTGEIVSSADRQVQGRDAVIWVSVVHGPLRDAGGTIIGTLTSILNITDRKVAEQRLQRNEESLAITLNSIADAVIATDTQGRVTRMNTSAERLTGWTSAEAAAKPLAQVFQIVNSQTRQPVADPVQLVLAHGEVVGLANHTVLQAHDGTEHHIADSAAPIRNAAGQVEGVVLVFSDVTETYRTQQALKESEIRFRAIFETNPECIEIADGDGRFVDVNAAGLVAFEAQSILELRQRTAFDFILPDYQEAFSRLHDRVLAGGSGVLEYEIKGRRGARRWLESHAAPLRDADGSVKVLVMSRDITRRKQAQAERRTLREQLRESQKLEAIGTLAGGIAHDFNNILGAISGNAVLALQDVGADHPAALSLTQIAKASARARALVSQILTFSRRQPQDLVTQPLQPLVEEAMALLRTTLPAMVKLEAELPKQPLYVNADGTQVEQVLMNLCTNAWHALQGNTGRIVVGLGTEILDADSAQQLLAPAPGSYAHLWVSDTGIGMDADQKVRIFEPFFTTKATGEGTGLGLSVVHGIVGAHRGAIAVDSAPGQGSTFHVYLPLVEPTLDVGPCTPDVLPSPAGLGQHVLYVDDDEVMVLLVERMLQRSGYQVTCFVDAAEAVAAVRAQPERFDLIVTDFNMPELSGLDVVRELAHIRSDLPVVITSGLISDELRSQAHRLGVRRLLQK
ncbi:MAG: PAS domain S-box protein, partial [Burkholderiaceae bacterium]